MVRLLIAHSSELFAQLLVRRLPGDMQVQVCHDGCQALALLQSFRPDALILDLHLPQKDGLTLLSQSVDLPRTVLGITGYCSVSVQRAAYALGVSQLLLMPSVSSLAISLGTMLRQAQDPSRKPGAREQTRSHLQNLGFAPHLDGSKQLAVALPLFAMDPDQTLSKELYPEVAKIMGSGHWRNVERSIRTAIQDAWKNRDRAVWDGYFPDTTECPNNKRFLSRLAEMIEL